MIYRFTRVVELQFAYRVVSLDRLPLRVVSAGSDDSFEQRVRLPEKICFRVSMQLAP